MRHDARVWPRETISATSSAAQPAMALSRSTAASAGIVGEVDVAHGFLGQPGAEHLVVGVTDAQAEQHPVSASVVEAFAAGEEQLADPIQRVVLAAAVAERLVLDAAADLVDAPVGDPHDMERVGDTGGVIEMRGQPGAERLGQIGGHHLDAGQPQRVGVGAPSAQVSGSCCRRPCRSRSCRSRSTSPVA